MDSEVYKRMALRTNTVPDLFKEHGKDVVNLLHGAMGASTEANELLDAVKRCLFYGKEIDRVNVIEEVGDLLWYTSIILEAIDASFDEAMQRNIDKLRTRYPDGFNADQAINRNIEAERKALEP